MTKHVLPDSAKAQELAQQDAIRRAGIGQKMKIIGKDPFELDLTDEDRVARALSLCDSRDSNDAELSAHLYYINESRAYLNHGFDNMREMVEAPQVQNGFAFSYEKARALMTTWENFRDLNLLPALLGGEQPISWSKFAALTPAIKAGIITETTVDQWLPLLTRDGADALTGAALKTLVKQTIADTKQLADDSSESTIKYTAALPADKYRTLETCEAVIMRGLGLTEDDGFARGQALVAALQNYAAVISGQDAEAWRTLGLGTMQGIISQVAPELTCVFVADQDQELDPDELGVIPITSVYEGVKKEGRKNVKIFTLATSEEDACAALDVESVVEHPLTFGSQSQVAEAAELAVEDDAKAPSESKTTTRSKRNKTNTRIKYERIPIGNRNSVLKALAKELSDKRLVTPDDYREAKERILNAIPDDSSDENYLQFTGVCEWLYDRLDEHGIIADLPA